MCRNPTYSYHPVVMGGERDGKSPPTNHRRINGKKSWELIFSSWGSAPHPSWGSAPDPRSLHFFLAGLCPAPQLGLCPQTPDRFIHIFSSPDRFILIFSSSTWFHSHFQLSSQLQLIFILYHGVRALNSATTTVSSRLAARCCCCICSTFRVCTQLFW